MNYAEFLKNCPNVSKPKDDDEVDICESMFETLASNIIELSDNMQIIHRTEELSDSDLLDILEYKLLSTIDALNNDTVDGYVLYAIPVPTNYESPQNKFQDLNINVNVIQNSNLLYDVVNSELKGDE